MNETPKLPAAVLMAYAPQELQACADAIAAELGARTGNGKIR